MLQAIPKSYLRPLVIDSIIIETPITLAPMAGHTNRAFRTLCRELGGCGLVCTELISSKALQYKSSREKSLEMFDWSHTEAPFAVQLFGNDPYEVAEAAKLVVDYGADIIDINMGCWVPKVAKKGGGAALLQDISIATAIVEATVKAVDVPVTVKVRSGWEDGIPTAIDFARSAEQVGAKAIAVHARFARQGFQGEADWEIIRQVKEVVEDLPVIGNGDIFVAQDAEQMFAQTNCDAVMIGRGALGRPWIFHHIAHYLETGIILPEPTRSERAQIALRHAQLTMETTPLPEQQAILEMRGQLSKYQLDEGNSVAIRNQLVRVKTYQNIVRILEPLQ